MKFAYDLYGFRSNDLTLVSRKLTDLLGIGWTPHESSYRCGAYYRSGLVGSEEEFILQNNYNTVDDEWTEPDFTEYTILLYASRTKRPEEIEKIVFQLDNVALLRRKVL